MDKPSEKFAEEQVVETDLHDKINIPDEIQELKIVVQKLVSIVSETGEYANFLEEQLKKVKSELMKNFYSFKKDFVEYKIQQSKTAVSQQLNSIEREVETLPWGVTFEQEFLKNVSTMIRSMEDAAKFVTLLDWMKSKQSPQQKEINYGIKNYTTSYVFDNSSERKH